MPLILVTNDDGVHSAGIHALADAIAGLGDVTIVAPVGESSAIGHALTLARPLRLERLRDGVYTVDGTPTDCVNLGVSVVLRKLPDLVVSGINKGYNLGDDVTYSGTVAGALEGILLGVPSIAVSLDRRTGEPLDFGPAAAAARLLAERVLRSGLPPRTLLNINVPPGPVRGYQVTVQGKRNHVTKVTESIDPRQRPYFWIEEGESAWDDDVRSDYHAVRGGWVSVTPLQPDLTHHDAMQRVEVLLEGHRGMGA
jgi:5'-nucleotidase